MNRIPKHMVVQTIKYVYTGADRNFSMVPLRSPGTVVNVHPDGYDVEFLNRKDPEAPASTITPDFVVVFCPEGSIEPTGD
jgi:hypothetical protein